MVQPTIIRNGIGHTLIRLQGGLESTTNIGTCQPHTIPLGADTLEAYREVAVSSREERRPCFLVSPGLLQNVSNL